VIRLSDFPIHWVLVFTVFSSLGTLRFRQFGLLLGHFPAFSDKTSWNASARAEWEVHCTRSAEEEDSDKYKKARVCGPAIFRFFPGFDGAPARAPPIEVALNKTHPVKKGG
jgi:hypothetical protein